MGMFDDLPMPFMVGTVKIWPAHSRPGFRWFIAYGGKPHWFRGKNEAMLFARDCQSLEDSENLCD